MLFIVFLWFLAHSVYRPKSLVQSCFVRRKSLASLVSVHTSPGCRIRQKFHIWYTYTPIPLIYTHQTFSDSDLLFLNGSHFGTFLCFVSHKDSHRDFIYCVFLFVSSLPTYTKEVIYFLKFMSIFLKFIYTLLHM